MSKITDEMVEAGAKTVWSQGTRGLHERKQHIRNILEAAFAALPAIEARGEMKVKPLEWNKHPTANLWRADSVVGLYQVAAIMFPATWTLDGIVGASASGSADGEIAAKAAAQADYERRILSALAHPVPTRESENARLREALRKIDWRGLFMTTHKRMRDSGESKEMGARWMAEAANKAIHAAIEET